MEKEKKKTFAQRLMLTYALIALIPIIILVTVTVFALQRRQVSLIVRTANAELDETVARIDSIYESIARIETAVRMRSDLINMLTSPEVNWNNYDQLVLYMDELEEIERELFLVSDIDNVHLFVFNETIPERWPIVVHASRLEGFEYSEPWDFSWPDVRLSVSFVNRKEYLLHSTMLTHSGRPYGILHTVVDIENVLSELYGLGEGGKQNDYAFRIDGSEASRILPEGASGTEYDSVPSSVLDRAVSLALSQGEERGELSLWEGIRRYELLYYYVEAMGLLFIKVCPTDMIGNTYWVYGLGGIAFFFLIMLFILFFSSRMTKRQTKSLVAIMEAMGEVTNGNFNVDTPDDVSGGDVEEARDALRSLTKQLGSAIEEIKLQESLLADTKIKAMQNQINVHFLINTVESIKMQAMMNGDEGVEHSLDLLGELFRYSLRWKESIVSLRDELDYIRTYIELMNFRNDFTIEYVDEVDPALETVSVPKMILQPVVENAFKYSFDIQGCDGRITIRSEELSDRIKLHVTNTGLKFDAEKRRSVLEYLKKDSPEKSDRTGSIGLKNIQMRLFMFYGDDFEIEIGEDEEKNTEIVIPVKKEVGS